MFLRYLSLADLSGTYQTLRRKELPMGSGDAPERAERVTANLCEDGHGQTD